MSFKFVPQSSWDKNHFVRQVPKRNVDQYIVPETSEVSEVSEVDSSQEKQVKVAKRRPVVTVRRPQATPVN